MNEQVEPEGSRGLSAGEAADRLVSEGYNELPQQKRKGFLRIALVVVNEQAAAEL
jgi:hypothetical protein